jgi:hypothetical protein
MTTTTSWQKHHHQQQHLHHSHTHSLNHDNNIIAHHQQHLHHSLIHAHAASLSHSSPKPASQKKTNKKKKKKISSSYNNTLVHTICSITSRLSCTNIIQTTHSHPTNIQLRTFDCFQRVSSHHIIHFMARCFSVVSVFPSITTPSAFNIIVRHTHTFTSLVNIIHSSAVGCCPTYKPLSAREKGQNLERG